MSIEVAEICVSKEPSCSSTKSSEQLMVAVLSSALILLKCLFYVNGTVSGIHRLYNPFPLPPSICMPTSPLPTMLV